MVAGIVCILVVLILIVVLKPSNFMFVLFSIFSVVAAIASISSVIELNDVKNNGETVVATVAQVAVVNEGDDTEYDVHFKYDFEGETYTYINHRGDKKYDVGDSVEAYIYATQPQQLYLNESFSILWAFFLLALGVIFRFAIRANKEEIPDMIYDWHKQLLSFPTFADSTTGCN